MNGAKSGGPMMNNNFIIKKYNYYIMDIVAIIILVGVILFIIIITIVIWRATNIFGGKKIGDDCVNDSECSGWFGRSAMCCKGKCTTAMLDYLRIGQCPEVCLDAPLPLGVPGSCGSGNTYPRSEGQPCDTSIACAGWIDGKAGRLACCNGTCQKQIKDYKNDLGFCPNECLDAPPPLGKPGSCGSGNTWPRSEGQPCDTSIACAGWVDGKAGTLACCNGTCQKQIKDYKNDIGFCPADCRDAPAPLGKPGSCGSGYSWPRKENQPCDTSIACEGWVDGKAGTLACYNKTCQKQIKDYKNDLGFCPADCRDAPAPLGKPGSCGSGNTWPRSQGQQCGTHADCKGWKPLTPGTLACCNSTCQPLLKDWDGYGYCAADCVGKAGGSKGTC